MLKIFLGLSGLTDLIIAAFVLYIAIDMRSTSDAKDRVVQAAMVAAFALKAVLMAYLVATL